MTEQLAITIDGTQISTTIDFIEKYNRPGPRYTSYPTVPAWNNQFGAEEFECSARAHTGNPLSLYFHLPFCSSLCLFCGCTTVISKNHEVSIPYLERLKREIDLIGSTVGAHNKVEQMHWGGGTPTYLDAAQIEDLFNYIAARFTFAADAELGIEVDPRVTSEEQLRLLRRLGFNRISLGVQDFDATVQRLVRRIQPFDMVQRLFGYCRALGFDSINVDLIYGLPNQTTESFQDTIERVIELNPDRIALFSYAHVPQLKKQQSGLARFLPAGDEKFRIFAMAVNRFCAAGYRYIGLDHFARPDDELCRAQDERTLHRNFQGYTTRAGCDLYALGMSSISSLPDVYAQNWSDLLHYYEAIDSGKWPTMRGFRLSREDLLRREVISRILCHCVLIKSEIEAKFGIDFDSHFRSELEQLKALEQDGLVKLLPDRINIIGLGRVFIRNVAMVFDAYLSEQMNRQARPFSKTL